jgi:sulfopyruvate decarboxylase subunit beta
MMTHRQALEVVARCRGQRVVIVTMGSVGIWPDLSDTPLDFSYLPSSMGQGVPLALGLALARPERGVIVVTGDGSLLMNLGCLATVAAYPAPIAIVVIDNQLYEVTGGQAIVNAGRIDYGLLARSLGIEQAYNFDRLDDWAAAAATILSQAQPTLTSLRVAGTLGQKTPSARRPMAEQIARLQKALAEGQR